MAYGPGTKPGSAKGLEYVPAEQDGAIQGGVSRLFIYLVFIYLFISQANHSQYYRAQITDLVCLFDQCE